MRRDASGRSDAPVDGRRGAARRAREILGAGRRAARECAPTVPLVVLAALLSAGCFEVGEPVSDRAIVAWAAYPETVLVDQPFSFELAGPVAPNTCGRLDTAAVAVTDSVVRLSADRLVYPEAWCSGERVAFYEVRPLRIGRPGRYPVRTEEGLELGTLVVVESGQFSSIWTRGLGTVREGGGCLLFGPGWASNQRPFALEDAPAAVDRVAGTDTLVRVDGRLVGFSLCGGFGSRPTIVVESVRVTERTGSGYYPEGAAPTDADGE